MDEEGIYGNEEEFETLTDEEKCMQPERDEDAMEFE